MNDSEIPTGTGIAWAIQQITKHFNNLSGSDGMPVEDTLRPQGAKTVRRPEPSQPILSAVPVLADPDGAVKSVTKEGEARESNASASIGMLDSRGGAQKTLEQEFYRLGDFGIKVVATIDYSSGIDDEPKSFTVRAQGSEVHVEQTRTDDGENKNFVGETLIQKEKMEQFE